MSLWEELVVEAVIAAAAYFLGYQDGQRRRSGRRLPLPPPKPN